jgi:hypothetical protein
MENKHISFSLHRKESKSYEFENEVKLNFENSASRSISKMKLLPAKTNILPQFSF